MTLDAFLASLHDQVPPSRLSPALEALWHAGRDDWHRAHDIAQGIDDEAGSWVHAYLHRKEGDIGNAHYWYRRAGTAPASGSLESEWRAIVEALLPKPR